MEEKKSIKVSLGTVICLFIIFILLVIIFAMYYHYNDKNNTLENIVPNKETNTINKDEVIIENNSIKLDDNKELVYDANYKYKNFSEESYYSESMKKTYSLKDINLPYININSEDANKANKEIKALFEELAIYFEEEYNDTKTWYHIASYKTYTNDKLLSILITVESGGTDVEQYYYYTYNFNLETLEFYNYEDAYKLLGFNYNNIDDKVENAIRKCERFSSFEEDITTYIDKSIENYNNSVKNSSIKYFIDENEELNVIVEIEIPVGRGKFDTIIKIK